MQQLYVLTTFENKNQLLVVCQSSLLVRYTMVYISTGAVDHAPMQSFVLIVFTGVQWPYQYTVKKWGGNAPLLKSGRASAPPAPLLLPLCWYGKWSTCKAELHIMCELSWLWRKECTCWHSWYVITCACHNTQHESSCISDSCSSVWLIKYTIMFVYLITSFCSIWDNQHKWLLTEKAK